MRLRNIERDTPGVKIYLKLEYMNPGGSVKDRPALQMMRDAIADGRLTQDKTLIDATSGNTGVAYSLFGACLGYRIALVMPSNVSQARKNITQAFGTELIYSDPMEGSDGAIRLVRKLVERAAGQVLLLGPVLEPLATRARTTWARGARSSSRWATRSRTSWRASAPAARCMGTTRRLREHTRKIACVAAEPAEALHGLEGLKHMGSSIVPDIYDAKLPDEILPVPTEGGWDMADRLAREEGLHVGHSTGANVWAARGDRQAHQGGLRRHHRLRSRRPLLRADALGEAL